MLNRALTALAALLLLSGCAPIQMNTELLIKPPRLSSYQSEIYGALEAAAGTSDIRFKYPQSGELRSAFVFCDLDGDAQDEAIVVYEFQQELGSTWINVLKQKEGKWVSVSSIAGKGTDIDFIRFARLTDPDSQDMIIGWMSEGQAIRNMVAYSFDGQRLKDEYSSKYTAVLVDTPPGQELERLLILYTNSSNGRTSLKLVGDYEIGIEVLSDTALPQDIIAFPHISTGYAQPGKRALFIEQQLADGQYSTSVIMMDNESLTNITGASDGADPTLRDAPVFSMDADSDGVTEIPSCRLLPGYSSSQEKEALYITDYMAYRDGSFETVLPAVVNAGSSYMIKLPERWDETVTIVPQIENGDWRFFEYMDDPRVQSAELLRIKVYSQNDYRDRFELESMIPLGSKGLFEYFGFLPEKTGNYLEISREELLSMFKIIE